MGILYSTGKNCTAHNTHTTAAWLIPKFSLCHVDQQVETITVDPLLHATDNDLYKDIANNNYFGSVAARRVSGAVLLNWMQRKVEPANTTVSFVFVRFSSDGAVLRLQRSSSADAFKKCTQ